MSLKKFKSLITKQRVFDCIENTFRPVCNGQERLITEVQTNGFYFIVTSDSDGKRYWSDMPKAADILEASTNGFGGVFVKMNAPKAGPGHTNTWKFYMEPGEEFRL